jgi:hypothetical protein
VDKRSRLSCREAKKSFIKLLPVANIIKLFGHNLYSVYFEYLLVYWYLDSLPTNTND